VLLAAAAIPAPLGLHQLDAPERGEVAKRRVGEDDDVTATAAVAAVGPALRHVLLAAEAEAAVAASPGHDVDLTSIVERHLASGEDA
jgi:hypothetical protein